MDKFIVLYNIDKKTYNRYNENMNIIYDKTELQKLLNDLHSLVGVAITFYDTNNNVLFYANYTNNDDMYCISIRNNPHTCNDCKLSDSLHFSSSREIQPYYMYTCHAGLIEIIMPLYYNNIKIGSLIIGKIRDREMIFSSPKFVENYIKKNKLDKALLKYYNQYPCLSHKEIQALINIINLSIQQLINEHSFKLSLPNVFIELTNYINDNLNKKITVPLLCKQFGINKNYLYKLFSTHYNMTVLEYINYSKINRAKTLLLETTLSISEIASKVGFFEYNYFISCFKKIMKISPLKYRKEHAYTKNPHIIKNT